MKVIAMRTGQAVRSIQHLVADTKDLMPNIIHDQKSHLGGQERRKAKDKVL